MAGGLLDDFLADVGAKDEYLRKSSKDNVAAPELPPVRGSAGKAPAPPAAPNCAAATAPPAAADDDGKPRHRKHAYEYFSEWDRYDVDGELERLEDAPDAAPEAAKEEEGLPPGFTAAEVKKLPAVEIERRALNEKAKGNEQYKAGEYRLAIQSYTHSLRLQQNNAVVYANRGMCHLKIKQFRAALADCTAAVQIDDGYTKAYLRRGIAHRRLSQHAQALKDLDVVLAREPGNKEAAEHRRCSAIELEKVDAELREAKASAAAAAAAPGKAGDQADDRGSRRGLGRRRRRRRRRRGRPVPRAARKGARDGGALRGATLREE